MNDNPFFCPQHWRAEGNSQHCLHYYGDHARCAYCLQLLDVSTPSAPPFKALPFVITEEEEVSW